ncbi:MAG: LysR family transcriptional regulator [Myxococcota bacterium]
MDRLECMQVFVAVAETSGFAAAARRLGVSPPVVTRAVASLEAHLGARVLTRTTRKVRLTEAGARYLDDCRRVLAELDDIESAVAGAYAEPRGALALTASVMFGQLYVAPILLDFLAQHRQVNARFLLSDRVLDLIDEGLDLAVRIAKLSDSSLTALRVGEVRRVVCASPRYLRKHGVPKVPEDLAAFDAIVFGHERSTPAWSFEGKKGKFNVRPRAQLLVNASEVGIQAALAGRGLTRVLSYMVANDVRAGRLKLVLEDYEPEPLPIHIVYREGRRAPARVRAFVDYASERLRADEFLNPRSKHGRRTS